MIDKLNEILTSSQRKVLIQLYQNCKYKSMPGLVGLDSRIVLGLFYGTDAHSIEYNHTLQEKFDDLLRTHVEILDGFNALNPQSRPPFAYRVMDEIFGQIGRSGELSRVSCKKGCAECCRMRVFTTKSEAEYIYSFITKNNIKVHWDRAEAQKGKGIDEYSTHILGEKNKCPLLTEDNICSVYSVRPCLCRIYYVITPAYLCNQNLLENKEKVACLDSFIANIIYSAYQLSKG